MRSKLLSVHLKDTKTSVPHFHCSKKIGPKNTHTKVNTTLRTNAVAELPPLQDFIVHLDCGLANLPPLQLCGQLFRGIDVRVDEVSVCVCLSVRESIHCTREGMNHIR